MLNYLINHEPLFKEIQFSNVCKTLVANTVCNTFRNYLDYFGFQEFVKVSLARNRSRMEKLWDQNFFWKAHLNKRDQKMSNRLRIYITIDRQKVFIFVLRKNLNSCKHLDTIQWIVPIGALFSKFCLILFLPPTQRSIWEWFQLLS